MQYRDFQDEKLSLYAMGCMRLPVIDGDDNAIDEPAAAAMVDYALEHGVNYFDTAWGYHGGNSELVVGRALARHPRDSFNLADKFPGYDLANFGTVEEIRETAREVPGDHFDFYLAPQVSSTSTRVSRRCQARHDLVPARAEEGGRIHLGFSVRQSGMDVLGSFRRLRRAYGSSARCS